MLLMHGRVYCAGKKDNYCISGKIFVESAWTYGVMRRIIVPTYGNITAN